MVCAEQQWFLQNTRIYTVYIASRLHSNVKKIRIYDAFKELITLLRGEAVINSAATTSTV